MNSPVTWSEINTADPQSVGTFYSDVFGWAIDEVTGRYGIVSTGGDNGISGGIGRAQGPNQVVFYIEVADPQATLDEIEKQGGAPLSPSLKSPTW